MNRYTLAKRKREMNKRRQRRRAIKRLKRTCGTILTVATVMSMMGFMVVYGLNTLSENMDAQSKINQQNYYESNMYKNDFLDRMEEYDNNN